MFSTWRILFLLGVSRLAVQPQWGGIPTGWAHEKRTKRQAVLTLVGSADEASFNRVMIPSFGKNRGKQTVSLGGGTALQKKFFDGRTWSGFFLNTQIHIYIYVHLSLSIYIYMYFPEWECQNAS